MMNVLLQNITWGCPLLWHLLSMLDLSEHLQTMFHAICQLHQMSYANMFLTVTFLGIIYYYLYLPINWIRVQFVRWILMSSRQGVRLSGVGAHPVCDMPGTVMKLMSAVMISRLHQYPTYILQFMGRSNQASYEGEKKVNREERVRNKREGVCLEVDLSDVGYDYLTETAQFKAMGKTKQELVKEVRRRRRIGDLPPVFPNGWFALLESSDVGAGQVKYVEALGENFAVFRSIQGKAYVLDAYCPHLGANMGIGGVVKGDCLECPFHNWQFRGEDGKCTTIPYAAKVPNFAKVKKWESCEVNDFIFVWYHAEGEMPSWQVERTEQIESGEWWYRGRSEFLINSHIEEIPENGADIAHLNAIHAPSLLGGSDLRYYQKAWHSFAQHTWSATWKQHTTEGEEHIGTMNLEHDVKLFNKFSFITMKVNARQIGPGYVFMHIGTSIGPIGIIQVVTPVEPLLQRVVHRVYCPPLLMLYASITLIGEAIMIERDIMVWNHKKYVKPLLVKEDQSIVRHRRWYSQFYSANSPRFTFQRDTLDW